MYPRFLTLSPLPYSSPRSGCAGRRPPPPTELADARANGLAKIKSVIPNYASNLTQKVFQIPALNVASAETVSVAFFEAMGALSHLRFAPRVHC